MKYVLKRSARRTLCIQIKSSQVVVLAPLKADIKDIEIFVEKHKEWIFKKLAALKRKVGVFSDVIEYKQAMLFGVQYEIIYAKCAKAFFDGERIVLPQRILMSENEERSRINALKKLYMEIAYDVLPKRLEYISEMFELKYVSLAINSVRKSFGSCNFKNELKLNFRLVMLDKTLIDYVILHELCHVRHLNHSKSFWALVSKFMPDYKKRVKQLKEFDIIMSIF